METYLQDHDNSLTLVCLLSDRCMSTSLKDSVYGMLKFLISNKMACAFNSKGKNKSNAKVKKLNFSSTRMCTALTGSVKAYEYKLQKTNTTLGYSTGSEEVIKTVGLWLKDAPKRYLLDLKTQKIVPDSEVSLPEEHYPVLSDDLDLDLDLLKE